MNSVAQRHPRGKLPAFGRELLEIRRQGLVPKRGFWLAHVVVVLDCWRLARGFQRLVIAPDDDPLALDFTVVAGLDVFLVWDSRVSAAERLKAAVDAVLGGQPHDVCAMDVSLSHEMKIIRAPKLGIERAKFP